jgi:NADPH-dependent 2,4-dienoyl-CoA reductase/sulfur reductase-like enzyme
MFVIRTTNKIKRLKSVSNYLSKLVNEHLNILCFSSQSSLSTTSSIDAKQTNLVKPPTATKVVICGGGLIGTSVAYHLAQLGYKDVVLVTRDKLGSGTTFYSTGELGIIKLSTSETLFSKYSANLYEKLQDEGHQISKFILK